MIDQAGKEQEYKQHLCFLNRILIDSKCSAGIREDGVYFIRDSNGMIITYSDSLGIIMARAEAIRNRRRIQI